MKKFTIKRLPSGLNIEGTEENERFICLSAVRQIIVAAQYGIDLKLTDDEPPYSSQTFTLGTCVPLDGILQQILREWIMFLIMDPDTKTRPAGSENPSFYTMDIEYNGVTFYNCAPLTSTGEFSFQSYKAVKGRLITLEGPDGSGKTTNTKHLVDALRESGYNVITTREPGGTQIAEGIRETLLMKRKPEDEQLAPMTELLLFSAARAQHIEKLIKPYMDKGTVVVCDRFCDTSFAYQGYGRGLIEQYLALEKLVHSGFEPDYTLFFNIDLPETERRLSARSNESNRLDEEKLEFKKKCMEGYQIRYNQNPHRMHFIDASVNENLVKLTVQNWVKNVFIPQNEGLRTIKE